MKIEDMNQCDLQDYIKVFVSVFNNEPWNDSWTEETASNRLKGIMNTDTFVGKCIIENETVIGLICGQKEYFYDGTHFQIQEFCINTRMQGQGIGTKLLHALCESLKAEGIINIYLITSRGERTEGYYLGKGFKTSDNMIVMSKSKPI